MFLSERWFRLSADAIACDERGLSIGGVPLLESNARVGWRVRNADTINRELSGRYGLEVSLESKMAGLSSVAEALQRGEIALAQIGALLLSFPDPPEFAKGVPATDQNLRLAFDLWASDLLRADWDENLHPRTGTPPNPGWFANKPEEQKLPKLPKTPGMGWRPAHCIEPQKNGYMRWPN